MIYNLEVDWVLTQVDILSFSYSDRVLYLWGRLEKSYDLNMKKNHWFDIELLGKCVLDITTHTMYRLLEIPKFSFYEQNVYQNK
jgi:hypothetical protein